ncbi:MAG: hypothetical protein ABMA64_08830 [Myxococcota bacterium]
MLRSPWSWLWIAMAACDPNKDDTADTAASDTDSDTDTDTDADSDTDTDADSDTDTDADSDTDTDADSDADADADADSDADTDPNDSSATGDTGVVDDTAGTTGDTGPDDPAGPATPVSISATCVAQANVLRYDCDVVVDPPQAVQIRYWRDDGLGAERIHTSEVVSDVHDVPIYFLAQEQDYTFEASAVAWPGGLTSTVSVTTGSVPLEVDSKLSMTGTSTMGLIGTEAPCSTKAIAVIYDTDTGDLVWFTNLDLAGELGLLDMVRFTDQQTVAGETDGNIVEIDLEGNDLVRFPVSYPGCCSLNHELFEVDDTWFSQYQEIIGQPGPDLTVDAIVQLDGDGIELYQWHPADHLAIPGGAAGDYLHTNSGNVVPGEMMVLSWLTQDTIAKIDLNPLSATYEEPLWLMRGDGTAGDLGNDITVDWSLVGGSDSFGGQHNVNLRRDGRLAFLDNDHGRGIVMTVDDATLTATVDGVYPTHEGICFPQGTSMETASGNPVVGCDTAWIREYDLASAVQIWEAEIECENGGGGGFTSGAATRWYPLDGWN